MEIWGYYNIRKEGPCLCETNNSITTSVQFLFSLSCTCEWTSVLDCHILETHRAEIQCIEMSVFWVCLITAVAWTQTQSGFMTSERL